MREGWALNDNGQEHVPDSYGQKPEQERQPRGRHAAPEQTRQGRHAAPAPPDGDVPTREAGRSAAPAPEAQGPGVHGGASSTSYGIMPSSGGAHTGHSSGPTAASGYGRVTSSGSVPAGAVPPAPATGPASTGQYGLMPAQATAARPEQPTTGTGPARSAPIAAPVAAPQAPPAASAPSSTDRSAASSLNLDGAPVRLEWWERLGGFLLQFRALRILMRVRMVLTWVSLLVVAVTLAVSPLARTVLGAWIGCFWIVAVCFWLARGKTVSWGMTSGIFAISMPWAGAVGWISFQVAAAARVPVDHAASQVVIAGVVEELAKLAPICLVAVIAPGRVRRLLIQDWLVLGVACGAGFMAVEEVARRLAFILGNTPGLQLSKAICPESPAGIVECMHARTFGLSPFYEGDPSPTAYAGHAIVTGLVAVSIGLARHLWWRARHHHPAFGVALRCMALGLPLGVLWVAIVDHMATNSTTVGTNWFTGERVVKAWGATKGEAPWPIVGTTSSMAGSGQGRGWLLLVMLVVAVLLDARVMRLGGYARVLASPGGGPGAPQGPPGGVAGRWGADVVEVAAAARAKAHRLRLALAQAATTRRPRLFLRAWAEHRIARDLAARRVLDAGPHRWATSALAAAAALVGAWIIYTVVPPVVTELNQRLNGLPAFWFAGVLDMLASVWESMSPTEKAALVLIGLAVVLLSGGTLGMAVNVGLGIATALDAARPAAQLVRDPWGATGHYLDTHNDLEVITDAGLAAMAVIPGGKALRGAGYAAKEATAAGRYAKDIPELFRQREPVLQAKRASRKRLKDAIPKRHSSSDFTRKRITETKKKLDIEGYSVREIERLDSLADEASRTRKQLTDAGTRIGEAGGEKYLTEQGYHIPEEFRADNVAVNNGTAPGGWVDGMAISPSGDEMVVSEYKGVSAQLSRNPVETRFEGKALQGTPAYARDHMLSDPRFAQYFHDHPDVWEGVKSGKIRLNAKTIYTKTPDRIVVEDQPFSLTPEVTQALQQAIDKIP